MEFNDDQNITKLYKPVVENSALNLNDAAKARLVLKALVVAPNRWNKFPFQIRSAPTLECFKSLFKTDPLSLVFVLTWDVLSQQIFMNTFNDIF